MNNKYELVVKWMSPNNEYVSVTVDVVYRQFPKSTLFQLVVTIDLAETKPISFYEAEAVSQAKEIIKGVVNEF
ncbi:DUF1327 domain-containing protein [Serratia sp. JSRIV004]|uniref:DUF1327 domain-containing protein n=1 Tax=Serratia sp. JSRIV004 TaxID=2831895 RepID=UPI001CBF438B|nr:DUF1327 domain-containing protein [Serratia sp. JSRIV004]UAN55341.1 DUF1327 domain-containing protein [Serratia sp. JSRIV004]